MTPSHFTFRRWQASQARFTEVGAGAGFVVDEEDDGVDEDIIAARQRRRGLSLTLALTDTGQYTVHRLSIARLGELWGTRRGVVWRTGVLIRTVRTERAETEHHSFTKVRGGVFSANVRSEGGLAAFDARMLVGLIPGPCKAVVSVLEQGAHPG